MTAVTQQVYNTSVPVTIMAVEIVATFDGIADEVSHKDEEQH